VSAEDHNSGKLILQHAIDLVKATGGTVCLGPGVYQLAAPLAIVGARSVRVRGQGSRTMLVSAQTATPVQIEQCVDVTVENLAVLAAVAGGSAKSVIGLRNNFGCRLQHLAVLGVGVGDAASVAIGLAGYAFGTTIEGCALAGDVGIASSVGEKANYLLTVNLGVEDNFIWCAQRGVSFERAVLHVAEARLRGNTIVGSRNAGVLATGGVPPGSTLNICGNVVATAGNGIVIGVDGARIVENDVSALESAETGDGIALVPGLDASGIDGCQILANRISGVPRNGIAIRTRVNSAMIKQNFITSVGTGGIVVEDGGSLGSVAIENNLLQDVAATFNTQGEQAAGIRLVATDRAQVLDNTIRNVARASVQAQGRAAIQLAAVTEARVAGNTIAGVGPASEQAGQSAGIQIMPSFFRIDVEGNSVRRAADDDEKLSPAQWRALVVAGVEGTFIATPGLVVVAMGELTGMFTNAQLRVGRLRQDNVSARGNALRGELTALDVVRIEDVDHCLLAENHCLKTSAAGAAGGQNVVQVVRGGTATATANRVRGTDPKLSSIALSGQKNGRAVLANVTGSMIQVENADILPPWRDLNIVAP
jgi:hypothetical protein